MSETAKVHVARMPSGDIEFTIDGPVWRVTEHKFYMSETDALELLDKIKAELIAPY